MNFNKNSLENRTQNNFKMDNNRAPIFTKKTGALSSNFNQLRDSADKLSTIAISTSSHQSNSPYGVSGMSSTVNNSSNSKNLLLADMIKKYQNQKQSSVSSTNSIDTKDIKKYYIKSKVFK
mmetsp:Transcript_36458/g.37847  ORF Transcript_36458/g.37847 Transcript_36458/m.37847 type:complete len:121 (+) Transcript_36458:681-1043(+)